MISLISLKKIFGRILANNNPFIIFSPTYSSGQEKLKWIEVGYDGSLKKEYIVSQLMDCMDSH